MPAFDEIPLVDNHLHPPLRTPDAYPFVRYFSEAADPLSLAQHVPHSSFYRWAIAELAGLLHCEPHTEAVVAARAALGAGDYLRLLLREANVEMLLVDDGYPPSGCFSINEIAAMGECGVRRVLRIESLAESLVSQSTSPSDLADRILRALDTGPAPIALKTIIAYRCGLQVEAHATAAIARAFAEVKAAAGSAPPRLTSKPLLDYLLLSVLDWAVARRLPVQFHTGYGDRDIDLPLANPALLRPLLEQDRFQSLQLVLLHAGYPYTRETAYLAAVYPNVYVDWSQVNPMLPQRQLCRVLDDLLAMAPASKLLFGSDAWGIPDWIWLAARAGRAALAAVLDGESGRQEVARRILRDNALALYHIIA